ncbi:hypothetical protein A3L11_01970 [Thermococcus siculi]|uniref:AAA domain-containing protein n=1 Tax=Thermococcus siculi TaxID=72803 RepID=A0A2Z2MQL4_9EURY|nr:hypothetical protein [Thermococcus siculi]ASJ08056.1 hypothetical protein A3L11_01970 [Thermococcus siculi]
MKISIKNVGPLKDAELELGDITVLLGPPNSGKSYTLKSAYIQLMLLDEVARERLFVKTVRELELLDRIETFIRRTTPRCLITAMAVYDYINQDNLDEILGILRERFGLDEIVIREEADSLVVALKITESINIDVIVDLFQENLLSLTQEILPLKEGTKIEIPELLVPELETIFMDILKTPHTWENVSNDEQLMISSLLHASSELGLDKNLNITIRIESKIPFHSPLWEQIRVYVSKELPSDKENVSADLVIKTVLQRSRIRLPLELSFGSMFRKLSRFGMNLLAYLTKEISEALKNIHEDVLGISSVLFVPFGRSPFVYQLDSISNEPYLWDRFVTMYRDNIVFYSYLHHLARGRRKLLKDEYDEKLARLFNPVLQGRLTFDTTVKKLRYQKWGSADVPITLASALAGEVSGIMLPILSIPPNSYLIIEEPEAQLHYSAQILMALVLAGLSKGFDHKILFSTHSDVLAITLAYLKELNYDENSIIKLIQELLRIQAIDVGEEEVRPLAKAVSQAKDLDMRFYYYVPKPDGSVEVSEISAKDILREVPGITVITDILASWALSL